MGSWWGCRLMGRGSGGGGESGAARLSFYCLLLRGVFALGYCRLSGKKPRSRPGGIPRTTSAASRDDGSVSGFSAGFPRVDDDDDRHSVASDTIQTVRSVSELMRAHGGISVAGDHNDWDRRSEIGPCGSPLPPPFRARPTLSPGPLHTFRVFPLRLPWCIRLPLPWRVCGGAGGGGGG